MEVGSAEVQEALATVSQALVPLKAKKTVTWITDRGFDDVAVWRTLWEQQEHVVCRISHTERTVAFQDRQGHWMQGNLAQAQQQVRKLARVETTLEVQRGKQRHPKRQPVEVDLAACPVRLTYSTGVRRKEPGEVVTKALWLVQVQVLGTTQAPWLLLTDWPVEDEQSALRIFIMYRERWAAEDSFKVTKECLGWEAVQVLDWQAAHDPGGLSLGDRRLSLPDGGDFPMGRSATAGQIRRLLTPQRPPAWQDHPHAWLEPLGRDAGHPSHVEPLCR